MSSPRPRPGVLKEISVRFSCDSPRREVVAPFIRFRSVRTCGAAPWIVAFIARRGTDAFWCARCGATARGLFVSHVVEFKHAHLGCPPARAAQAGPK